MIEKQLASAINSISPYALSEEKDRLLSLAEQRDLQNEVLAWTGNKAIAYKPYVVSLTGEEFEISRISSAPVILRHADIDHIFKRHAQDIGANGEQSPMSMQELIANLNRLPEELAENVLAYDDPEKDTHICIVLGERSRGNNELIAVANVEKEMAHTSVVNIITVHGRDDLFKRIEQTALAGRSLYFNERTGSWIESSPEKPGETTNCLYELYQASKGEYNTLNVNDALEIGAGDWVSRAGVPFPERTFSHLQSLLYQNGLVESTMPDGYHWTSSYGKNGDITGALLYAPDGEPLVVVDFRKQVYRDYLNGKDWQPAREGYLLTATPEYIEIAWQYFNQNNTVADKPKPSKAVPTPKAKKAATPQADQRSVQASARAQAQSRLNPSKGQVR